MAPAARWTQAAQRSALRIAMGQAGITTQLPDTTVDEFLADALAAVNTRAPLHQFGYFSTVAAQQRYTDAEAGLTSVSWIDPPKIFDRGSAGTWDWNVIYSSNEFETAPPSDDTEWTRRPLNADDRAILTRFYATDTAYISDSMAKQAIDGWPWLRLRFPVKAWYDEAAARVVLDPTPVDVHRAYWVARVMRFATPYAVTDAMAPSRAGTYAAALMAYAVAAACFPGADLQSMILEVQTGTGKSIKTAGGSVIERHGEKALRLFAKIFPLPWAIFSV